MRIRTETRGSDAADVELADYPSVFLWCVKFSVSFGAAEMGSLR